MEATSQLGSGSLRKSVKILGLEAESKCLMNSVPKMFDVRVSQSINTQFSS